MKLLLEKGIQIILNFHNKNEVQQLQNCRNNLKIFSFLFALVSAVLTIYLSISILNQFLHSTAFSSKCVYKGI